VFRTALAAVSTVSLLTIAAPAVSEGPPVPLEPVRFTEIQESAGLAFHHRNGAAGKKYMVETMGSGGGFSTTTATGATTSSGPGRIARGENFAAGARERPLPQRGIRGAFAR